MKKEFIICLIVIALVTIGNVITQNYTKECIYQINKELVNLKEEIKIGEKQNKEQHEKFKQKSEDIKDLWDNMQEILSFYIEHDELEKVETQLFLLAGEMETKLYEDAVPEIEKCEFILEHIGDKTSLNVKNIF